MDFFLTNHAKKRMAERSITRGSIKLALQKPDQILYDKDGQLLVKKIYTRRNQKRLLIIVATITASQLKIIRVIETSKVKKYS